MAALEELSESVKRDQVEEVQEVRIQCPSKVSCLNCLDSGLPVQRD